jgi:hypothetical protein
MDNSIGAFVRPLRSPLISVSTVDLSKSKTRTLTLLRLVQLIGTILSVFLAGVTLTQCLEYFQNFGKSDRKYLVVLVSFLLVCDVFHTAISWCVFLSSFFPSRVNS